MVAKVTKINIFYSFSLFFPHGSALRVHTVIRLLTPIGYSNVRVIMTSIQLTSQKHFETKVNKTMVCTYNT